MHLLSRCMHGTAGLALKGGTHPDIDPSMVLERPKVLRNPQTGKFVMWMHIDSGDYELARLGVAVSDNPHGPFRYQGSFRPHGQQSRDFTVFAVRPLLRAPRAPLLQPSWHLPMPSTESDDNHYTALRLFRSNTCHAVSAHSRC